MEEESNYNRDDCSSSCCPANGNCEAIAQQSLMFSASQDAEPSIVAGGIYSYENNSIYPKFYDTETSVEEPEDDENERTVVLSTTQPLRPFFNPTSYGLYEPWDKSRGMSDAEYLSGGGEIGDGETGYTSGMSAMRKPRRPVGKVSTPLVAWNVVNMMMNLSILALPFAIASGGILSIVLIPIVALLSGYTGKLLIDCMYEHSVRRRKYKTRIRLDYVEIGQDFFNSEIGGKLIHVLQTIDMLCVCILNINVLGSLCYEMFHNHLSIEICSVIGVAIALPTFFINRLGLIAWMHLVGVTSLAIGLMFIQGYCLANVNAWSISGLKLYDLEKIPITIGIIVCSFGIHSALPGVEQQMNKPKQYRPMLAFTFSLGVFIKVFVGLTNALFYGKGTDQVITVDLEYHLSLGIASSVFIFISVLCLFALPTFVIMEGIDEAIAQIFPCCRHAEGGYSFWLSFINRLMIMGISLMVAILVPQFALLMAFIGNTISTLLSLTIPCVFHLKMKKDRLRWYHYVCNWLIIILSIFSMLTGIFFTGKELHKRL